jgi:cytochrome c553
MIQTRSDNPIPALLVFISLFVITGVGVFALGPGTTYQPEPIDPALAQTGRWLWTDFRTSAATYPPVQIWMDVSEGGAVDGLFSIYPNYPEIPAAALTLIQQNGCNVSFKTLESETITGMFVGETEARFKVAVKECNVKFYGGVTLIEPLEGNFVVEYNDVLTQALLNPEPPTPVERGRRVFTMYCSACHGSYGEGMPGIPSLHTDQVRNYTDSQILTIVRNGVINTVMPAWGNVLPEEDIAGVLELVRHIDEVLGEQ